jgi:hypothetical protein
MDEEIEQLSQVICLRQEKGSGRMRVFLCSLTFSFYCFVFKDMKMGYEGIWCPPCNSRKGRLFLCPSAQRGNGSFYLDDSIRQEF